MTEQHVIYFKLRDKFTFNVGAGLTLYNIKINGLDSTYFPEHNADMDSDVASSNGWGAWTAPVDP